jgi:hypothetical protein
MTGHSTGRVTARYVHHLDAVLIAAADRVSTHIFAAMTASDETVQKVSMLHPVDS